MKKRQNQSEWLYGWDNVKRSATQGSQWRIGVVRKQVQAGTLESFHLKENVKYPVKRFNNAKDCKAPDLLHPARALTKLESQSN